MNNKVAMGVAGMVAIVVVASAALGFVLALNDSSSRGSFFNVANLFLNALYYSAYGIVGALVLARQPRNTVAWLLLVIGVFFSVVVTLQDYLGRVMSPIETPNWMTFLYIWMSNVSWWLLLGPLLLMLLVFPTGRLLSRRWRWIVGLIGLLFITFLALALVSPTWSDANSGKIVRNPFGALPITFSFDTIFVPWAFVLCSTVAFCVVSVLIRYRRSNAVEREQLKWFLYACGVFLVAYVSGFIGLETAWKDVFSLCLDAALLFIPISIGIAILRYRLFDIEIIIRRTLIYSILTAILALFYLGSVLLLQQLLRFFIGQGTDLAIILSTLGSVVLFNPLRRRIQQFIDRQFYRRKYNAAQVLATFAAAVRDEVDLGRLTDALQTVVEETMQPTYVSIWIRKSRASGNVPKGGV